MATFLGFSSRPLCKSDLQGVIPNAVRNPHYPLPLLFVVIPTERSDEGSLFVSRKTQERKTHRLSSRTP